MHEHDIPHLGSRRVLELIPGEIINALPAGGPANDLDVIQVQRARESKKRSKIDGDTSE